MDKEYLIEKWLKGDLTDAEMKVFSQLEDYQLNKDILESAKYFKASHFSNVDDFKTFKKENIVKDSTVHKLNWMQPLIRIASVVVIAFGIYFTFFYNQLTRVQTLASEKTTIELPDHSKVTLNALSEIAFNESNWEDDRSLKLQGEAYFKVAKGKKFDVITTDGIVTVVGTEFNVKQRDNYFEVKCFEGIVEVASDTIVRQLIAGDTYQIINGNFMQLKTIHRIPQWTNNISSFMAIPLREVLAELERQYNVKITFKNVDINRTFTGGFVHDNIENALISIVEPMNLTYEISTSNQVVIHGYKK